MRPTPVFDAYLQSTAIVDWQTPSILAIAKTLADNRADKIAIAKTCFTWVRDEIRHSVDNAMNPVTCRASEVLQHKTGFCFAKSHLLAALLRANQIPAGFCYQRLSIDDQGPPYSLHGFNAVYLPNFGWYRVDARGNKPGIHAQFAPPVEQLAYAIGLPEERDFPEIFADPLPAVIQTLQTHTHWEDVMRHLPDSVDPGQDAPPQTVLDRAQSAPADGV